MVQRLLARQASDWWQHAKGVGSEEQDAARVRALTAQLGVVDKLNRVGHTRVFGERDVAEIGHAAGGVDHHIFGDRAKADGVPDLRLAGLREVDALGVAAALEVEDAVVAPAVFVVANQAALGVGRKGGFAGAGQAEEECAAAIRADVGRAVHREHALLG